jgi:spermidine/putrescine transport system permease protein
MALSALVLRPVAVPLSRYTIRWAGVQHSSSRGRAPSGGDDRAEERRRLGANTWNLPPRTLPPMRTSRPAATLSLDDFVITFFVSGPGSTTLPVRVYSMIKFGVTPEVNAISTLMLLGSTVLVVVSLWLQRK